MSQLTITTLGLELTRRTNCKRAYDGDEIGGGNTQGSVEVKRAFGLSPFGDLSVPAYHGKMRRWETKSDPRFELKIKMWSRRVSSF